MKLHGLLITKDDDIIIEDWFVTNAHLFSTISVVDGSESDYTKNFVKQFDNVVYSRDPEGLITDQTLRHKAFEAIKDKISIGDWIYSCHVDEFFIHNPRDFMDIEQNVMMWMPLEIRPHPSERKEILELENLSPRKVFKHYWWRRGGKPHCEFRMWRYIKEPEWNITSKERSKHILPINYYEENLSYFLPLYFHYKIIDLNINSYTEAGAYVKSGLNTGINQTITSIDDLFFDENSPSSREDNFSNDHSTIIDFFGNPPKALCDKNGNYAVYNDHMDILN